MSSFVKSKRQKHSRRSHKLHKSTSNRGFTPATSFTSDGNTVALWHLNEGSGTSATDSSGNGHTGTLTGSPTPTWVTR